MIPIMIVMVVVKTVLPEQQVLISFSHQPHRAVSSPLFAGETDTQSLNNLPKSHSQSVAKLGFEPGHLPSPGALLSTLLRVIVWWEILACWGSRLPPGTSKAWFMAGSD